MELIVLFDEGKQNEKSMKSFFGYILQLNLENKSRTFKRITDNSVVFMHGEHNENVFVVFKDCKYFAPYVHHDKSLLLVQRVFPNETCSRPLTTAVNW